MSPISRCMRSSRAAVAVALAGFGLLTLAVFRPTLSELAHTSPAFRGSAADALLLVWAMDHVSRALFSDPLHLFDAGIYHPARYALAYGDHMIGEALAGLPVWLASPSPLLEYNVLALASSFALVMGMMSLVALAAAPTRRAPRLWIGTALAPLAALALLAPTLWPYAYLRSAQGNVRTAGLDTTLPFFLPGPGTLTGRL